MRDDVLAMIDNVRRWALKMPADKVVRNDPDEGQWTAEDIVFMCGDPENFPEIVEYATIVHGLIQMYRGQKNKVETEAN